MYDLEGKLLITSEPFGLKDSIPPNLLPSKVSKLNLSKGVRVFEITENNNIKIENSYTYILDSISNRIGILKLEFNQDNTTQEYELKEFLTRLILVYFFMFLIAIMLAYFTALSSNSSIILLYPSTNIPISALAELNTIFSFRSFNLVRFILSVMFFMDLVM